jgi:hypothetical protein
MNLVTSRGFLYCCLFIYLFLHYCCSVKIVTHFYSQAWIYFHKGHLNLVRRRYWRHL